MPGREDLIQKNAVKAAKASAAINTPQPQESQGKSATPSVGGPRNLFGGNIDVYSALDKVEFQGELGDDSLRGNIAYIRLWKRGGSVQQSSASQQTIQPPQSDSQETLKEDLEAAIENRDSVANGFDPTTGEYSYNPYGDVDNPIEVAEANIQIAENQLNEERQKAIASQTPTASVAPSTATTTVPVASKASTTTTRAMGAVKSANPNGLLNVATKIGKAVIGLPQGKPEYSGKLNDKSASVMAPTLGEMMWQFLFNPSELELEVGPEFKNAEVWGVSDKANSGQPLHWSHNKNAQLKFNSILLNGFVFGRKVEALEQGLIELFMARDGEGQHGPHVLEFVWGKRVFGPCVMKNVNIKEKMWDEGEVVNAEVSFTLEQVPEWTINDGFVDVARPGRQQLAANPVPGTTGAAGAATPAGTTIPPNGNPGDRKSQDQKTRGSSKTVSENVCKRAYYYAGLFANLRTEFSKEGFTIAAKEDKRRKATEFLIKFQNAAQELGSNFAPMSRSTEIYKKIEELLNPNRPGGRLTVREIKGYVSGYIQEAVNRSGGIYNDPKKCPTTSGATVQPSRTYGGVNTTLSTPKNL